MNRTTRPDSGQRRLWRDLSLSAVVAGFVAVLVGFTSSVAIVFAAAQAVGADAAQTTSWIWALGLGMGLSSIGLSLHYRQPVLTAWSTPGAALIAGTQGVALADATGAFVVCALLIIVAGFSGAFERVMQRIPQAVAAALLAGVLARFALDAVPGVRSAPLLVLAMTLAYLVARRWLPRYAVPLVLVVALIGAALGGDLRWQQVQWEWARPVWVTPAFSLAALISVALPLFIVTMASQNLPGVAAQRASGYHTPVSPVHHHHRRVQSAAGAVRRLCLQPGRHHRRHLHGPRGARRCGAPLHRGGGGGRVLHRARPGRRRRSSACSPRCPAKRWWRWPRWRCWAPLPVPCTPRCATSATAMPHC